MNLVCDKAWIAKLIPSLLMLGKTFGGVIGGFLSDRYFKNIVGANPFEIMAPSDFSVARLRIVHSFPKFEILKLNLNHPGVTGIFPRHNCLG